MIYLLTALNKEEILNKSKVREKDKSHANFSGEQWQVGEDNLPAGNSASGRSCSVNRARPEGICHA